MTTDGVQPRLLDVRSGLVDRAAFQRWAFSVGETNPLYFSTESARAAGHPDVVMPPMFLPCVVVQPMSLDDVGPDGAPEAGFGISFEPGSRLMAGGEQIGFSAPCHPGDVITAHRYLDGIEHKRGRSGDFRLLRRRVVYTNQNGVEVAVACQTVIVKPPSLTR